ncbi:hypothetical protein F5884DRAFT_759385 [Xylogone sp. PMI_703]|nr:hypothetical protein F5884DRAFT_759385 [Xylogone sp. PMI_703]
MAASKAPLVRFYDLSGPRTWSPYCCRIRYVLNYKDIPYETVKLSYPGIRPVCEKLFPDMTGIQATVPIVETLDGDHKVVNDSTPVTKFLNERFPASAGFRDLKDVDKFDAYAAETGKVTFFLFGWVAYDVWANALDKNDGSREYFRRTREERVKYQLEQITQAVAGGEEQALEGLRKAWNSLRERMQGQDGSGEPTYLDFCDAGLYQWIERASAEKGKKLMSLWGDDTFEKLLKKVEPYSFE